MQEKKTDDTVSIKQWFVPFTTTKAIAFLVIIGITVFFNGLFNNFVGDDLGQIVENPLVHSITNLPSFFSGSTFFNGNAQALIGNYYRPFFISYFATIYSFFGPNYAAFHFFQIALHITNSILLFTLFKRIFKKTISFFLALIFLIHPINSEVVLYISDTQEILFFLFGMLYLLLLQKNKPIYSLWVATVSFAASLFSKETGVLFLGITTLYIFLFKKKDLLKVIAPGVVVVLFYILLRFHAVGFISRPTNSVIASFPFTVRLLNVPLMFEYYLKTFLFPTDLASSYQWVYTKIDVSHFFIPLLIDLSFLGIFSLGLYILKKKKEFVSGYLFFAGWFFIGMAIHMQIIPLDATVAEGWFYFPMVGLLGMIGVMFEVFDKRINRGALLLFGIFVVALLSARTFLRTYDWRNQLTIASHDLKVSKEAWGLENELSYAYFNEGRFKDAKVHANRSIRLHPFMTNYLNLGAADFALHEYSDARSAFLTALKYGDLYQIHENLAFLALSFGDPKKNMEFIKNVSLAKYPSDGKLWFCLAALEYNFGDKQKAKDEIAQAYYYDQSLRVIGVYNAIMNNQPVRIDLKQ